MAKRMQELQPLPQGDPGEVQGRQGAADQGDLRPLQEARRQPGQRLPAGPDPAADLRRALAGPEHQRRASGTRRSSGSTTSPPRHALPVPVRDHVPGPLVQPAAVPGRGADAGADQALLAPADDARGGDAAEDDEVHDDLHGLHVLQGPLRPGHLLHHQQPLVDRRAAAAAQDHPRGHRRRPSSRTRIAARGRPDAARGPTATARPLPRSRPAALPSSGRRSSTRPARIPTYRKMVEERDGRRPSDRNRRSPDDRRDRDRRPGQAEGRPAGDGTVLSTRPEDTIAAVASPPGRGCGGWSGSRGLRRCRIALAGFQPDSTDSPPRRAEVRRGSLRVEGLRPRLPALLALWPAPRTYTGQDVAEIHTVGLASPGEPRAGPLPGPGRAARPAGGVHPAGLPLGPDRPDPGRGGPRRDRRHATRRSSTPRFEQLAGGLSGPILALRDRLLDLLAHLEANLDFVEEPDVDPLGRAVLAEELARPRPSSTALAGRLTRRDRPDGHPRVVLIGPPNAGKSRLFNALLGDDHAIVSPHAGTTRDYLSAPCECAGMIVELVDTAGIEDPRDAHRDPGPVVPRRPGRAGRPRPGLPFRRH